MNVLNRFHPSFDTLSAFADASDVDASRTRVAAHVVQCATCQETVAEIRAMGDAARAVELPGVPAGLWSKIEQASLRPPAVAAKLVVAAPQRVSHRWRNVGIALAAAAVVVVALLLPSPFSRSLAASPDTGTWHFSPANPQPGARVRVRFEAPATFAGGDRLMLLGLATPAFGQRPISQYSREVLEDSLGMLQRVSDETYEGSVTAPQAGSALIVHVAPPMAEALANVPDVVLARRIRERPVGLLVLGDAQARPSFASLASAAPISGSPRSNAHAYSVADTLMSNAHAYSVADTLIRFYPSQPLGYAMDRRVGGKRLIDDLIAYFGRGEKQYAKFKERLMPQPALDADRELAMATFADRISDPAESRLWVMRLVREHPDDPRTLEAFAGMMSGLLARYRGVDTVRRELPIADSLYVRNGTGRAAEALADIALRSGDRAGYARWTVRGWQASGAEPISLYFRGLDPDVLLGSAAAPAAAMPMLRAAVARTCALPAGEYPALMTVAEWRAECARGRTAAFVSLSKVAQLKGDRNEALVDADSAVTTAAAADLCWYREPHRVRGDALLALGDTVRAVPELVAGTRGGEMHDVAYRDSLRRAFGGAVGSARFDGLVAANDETWQRCVDESRRKTRERKGLSALPGA